MIDWTLKDKFEQVEALSERFSCTSLTVLIISISHAKLLPENFLLTGQAPFTLWWRHTPNTATILFLLGPSSAQTAQFRNSIWADFSVSQNCALIYQDWTLNTPNNSRTRFAVVRWAPKSRILFHRSRNPIYFNPLQASVNAPLHWNMVPNPLSFVPSFEVWLYPAFLT